MSRVAVIFSFREQGRLKDRRLQPVFRIYRRERFHFILVAVGSDSYIKSRPEKPCCTDTVKQRQTQDSRS